MILNSRYDATLNGHSLSDVAEEIIIRDIIEEPPKVDRQTDKRALRHGYRVSGVIRRSLSVRIVYNVRAYDESRRAEILDSIARWAGDGGWLTISTRPMLRLYVRPEDFPSLSSSLKWTEDLSLTLTAYEQPYWEERLPAVLSAQTAPDGDGYAFSGALNPRGTVQAVPVTLTMTNTGGAALTNLTITAADTSIVLERLSVQPGEAVAIAYTDDDILTITGGGASILSARTAESSDELLIRPGQENPITITSDAPVSGTVEARGRWR